MSKRAATAWLIVKLVAIAIYALILVDGTWISGWLLAPEADPITRQYAKDVALILSGGLAGMEVIMLLAHSIYLDKIG